MEDEKILLTEEEIKTYLDKNIRNWRRDREEQKKLGNTDDLIASYYIDAFQSVRCSLFGKTLPVMLHEPEEEKGK